MDLHIHVANPQKNVQRLLRDAGEHKKIPKVMSARVDVDSTGRVTRTAHRIKVGSPEFDLISRPSGPSDF